jgi:YHS domain-containing protein
MLAMLFVYVIFAHKLNNGNGLAPKRYDVNVYFNNKVLNGEAQFKAGHKQTTYYFSSQEIRELFMKNSSQFITQYGGWFTYYGDERKTNGYLPKDF